jgi:hypothetical protein
MSIIFIVTEIIPNITNTNYGSDDFDDFIFISNEKYCKVKIIGVYKDENTAKSKIILHPYRQLHIQKI